MGLLTTVKPPALRVRSDLLDDPELKSLISDLESLLAPNGLIIMTHIAGHSVCYTLETFKAAAESNDYDERFDLAEVVEEHFEDLDTDEVYEAIYNGASRPRWG
ncbi:MAG: hypothetical protein ACRCXC_02420 [Legionella sp.]